MRLELRRLTGRLVKEWYHWLITEGNGCCSGCFDSTEKYGYAVCVGWHHYDDEMVLDKNGNPVHDKFGGVKYRPVWKIAWKIGRQTHDNIMQCDFDVDFEMPSDPKTGDVDDTLEVIECATLTNRRRGLPYSAPSGYPGWDALASYMRRQARRVFRDWKDRDE